MKIKVEIEGKEYKLSYWEWLAYANQRKLNKIEQKLDLSVSLHSSSVLTGKGLALIAAIESGLLPQIEGGWDETKFEVFWKKYEEALAKNFPTANFLNMRG